jgi:acetylornithine/succinyldiaminopimelate/putrescine aminotransferase/acyl-coenzyme A synthetase/AMP-(fatty) acid ligase/predicted amino acid dehydrogenase
MNKLILKFRRKGEYKLVYQEINTAMSKKFDRVLSSGIKIKKLPVHNIASLIFKRLEHRSENSKVVLSHDGNSFVSVSLNRLRFIICSLFEQLRRKGIRAGDTVLLASIPGNNELFIALMFTALSSYGVRVLLPMFMETAELSEWLQLTKCKFVILPEQEILSLNHHKKEKDVVTAIKKITCQKNLSNFDIWKDFNIKELLYKDFQLNNFQKDPLVKESIQNTCAETDAMIITTSGSSGKSKLVVYEQGAFIRSCLSWQEAKFYRKKKLGGRGFTPLFTHTMGVRAYFNALWTGAPVCLINTEWFEEKPEAVRYFIMQMKPEHITGGPSVFNLLLELMRNFPEIKSSLRLHIKTIVSSGAPLDDKTARAVESTFGIKMNNAYGTTETQQALSTLLYDKADGEKLESLGLPLPGVNIGLRKLSNGNDYYKLFINSPFGAKKIIGEENNGSGAPKGFFYLGDIVRLEGRDTLIYVGRENRDFLKDGFGVKIPLSMMKEYYKKLYEKAVHIEYYPVKNKPGLGALIIIDNNSLPEGRVTDRSMIKQYSSLLAEINAFLFKNLEPFEFRHRFISRFVLVNSQVPKTGKGTVSKYKIESRFADAIDALNDPYSRKAKAEDIESRAIITDTFTQHLNPYIGQMLACLGIDYTYHRGKKDALYTFCKGKEIEILDFVGGYGTNLLGHNNDELKSVLVSFLKSDEVSLSDQASIQRYAGMLAEELNLTVGAITGKNYNVLFGSSGSEAVEIALHHALFEWWKRIEMMEQKQYQRFGEHGSDLVREVWERNRRILSSAPAHVITLKNAFHGNSAGPRALLGNGEKRKPFRNIMRIMPIFVDDNSPDWKTQIKQDLKNACVKIEKVGLHKGRYIKKECIFSTVISAIAEPIIGEGGVREVKKELLDFLSKYNFPLIMDEIQCGLGRSGSFLASEGIDADYYLFAKALGGGIEKISAVIIDKDRYIDKFGEYYVSTFSNGGMAAKIAHKVISIIKRDNLPERAFKQGKKLSKELKKVQQKYPTVIAELLGKGLMQGIRFRDFSKSDSFFLRTLYEHKSLGLLFSAYLLRKHNVRVLPTLSAPNTLRIEPSAYVTQHEIEKFVNAIDDLAEKIHRIQLYELSLPLIDGDPFEDNRGNIPKQGFLYTKVDKPSPHAEKVAFIAHFAYPVEELRLLEKEFCKSSDTGLRILFNKMQLLMEMKPFVLFAKNIFGDRVHFSFICIPLDSAALERFHKQGKRNKLMPKIQDAVDLAAKHGAKIVSLGGYTSILTNNGTSLLEPEGVKIITGNTLTAASGIRRLSEEIEHRCDIRKKNKLAIIGAAGNIGSIIAEEMLNKENFFEKIFLIGCNKDKLEKLVQDLGDRGCINDSISLEIATDFSPLKQCDVITVATNTSDPVIFPHHLNTKTPVFISDMSVPSAISRDVAEMKNVTNVPFVSYITLPEDPDFIISSYTPKGSVFCCAAEAILCALERVPISLKGKISPEAIAVITRLADKYRFFEKMGTIKSYKAIG